MGFAEAWPDWIATSARWACLVVVLSVCPRPMLAADKIAAIDLCADQAVVALVDHADIAGLSRWAIDPNLSPVAEQARTLPTLKASAETVLMSGAKTVVADAYGDFKTIALLQRLGVTVFRMPAADNFPDVMSSLEKIAQDLDETARGEALRADLQARLDHLAADRPATRPLAAYYRPDGGTAGSGTAVDAAFAAAGYRNLAGELGERGWGKLDLETLVMHPPEVVVTSFFNNHLWSLHNGFAQHPVFQTILRQARLVGVPARLWSCGGWPLVAAAETLAAARDPAPQGATP